MQATAPGTRASRWSTTATTTRKIETWHQRQLDPKRDGALTTENSYLFIFSITTYRKICDHTDAATASPPSTQQCHQVEPIPAHCRTIKCLYIAHSARLAHSVGVSPTMTSQPDAEKHNTNTAGPATGVVVRLPHVHYARPLRDDRILGPSVLSDNVFVHDFTSEELEAIFRFGPNWVSICPYRASLPHTLVKMGSFPNIDNSE